MESDLSLGIQEDMFTEPHKLHFTIGVMWLMDDNDRSHAIQLLNECCDSIVMYVEFVKLQEDLL